MGKVDFINTTTIILFVIEEVLPQQTPFHVGHTASIIVHTVGLSFIINFLSVSQMWLPGYVDTSDSLAVFTRKSFLCPCVRYMKLRQCMD